MGGQESHGALGMAKAKMIGRRDFLKKSGQVALALGGGLILDTLLSSCATIHFKEEAPVIYPPLKGHKVQPPDKGCLFGFYQHYANLLPGYKRSTDTGTVIDKYERQLGQKPSILVLFERIRVWSDFPMQEAVGASSKDVIPLIYAEVGDYSPTRDSLKTLKDIANGKYDRGIRKFAQGAIKFGEKYGGFYITTMREMNGDWYVWGQKPKLFKQVWRRIWQIFEDAGANHYARWVIEYHVDRPLTGYYPGDAYVDWIGLSAYNRKVHEHYYGYRYLGELILRPYSYFRHKYKDKPIMLSEFGSSIGKDQPKWLEKAYKAIKLMPGMKAVVYWDNLLWASHTGFRDDHTLTQQSRKVLKELLKNPYYIGSTEKGWSP